MKLKLHLAGLGLATALLLAFAFTPAASAAKKTTNTLSTPANGTAVTGEAVTGTFVINHFVNQDGAIWAVGNVTNLAINGVAQPDTTAMALVTAINGVPVGSAATAATANTAAAAADPTCNILSLTLGPLHLNLLGLVVDLNQVVLTINAVSGSGNLLGNLLCAVANLLNGAGGINLTPITNLLNNILAAL